MIRKNPAFSLVAVCTLALGIGANTAIFSVVNAILLRALPYAQPERLSIVTIDRKDLGPRFTLSEADTLLLRERMQGFESMAALRTQRLNLTDGTQPERVTAMWVTADFFRTLGVPPELGRDFAKQEDRIGTPPVVMVSHALWRRHLSGEPGALGKTLMLNDQPYTVVGVMPPDFNFLRSVDVWPILQMSPPTRRPPFSLWMVGRVAKGVGPSRLQAELAAMHDAVERVYPDPQKADWAFVAEPMKEVITGNVRPALLVLLVAVGFVLLIAASNVANLLLSNSAAREKEIAVRAALGAGRARLIRQLLTESLLLALAGGGLGLLLAIWGLDLLPALEPGNLPRLGEVKIDNAVLLFTSLVSLATGVLFGLAPALQISRGRLGEVLKESARSVTGGRARQRLRGLLVVTQTTLAMMLLVAAGLMVRSFISLVRLDPGFAPEGLLTAQVSLPKARYPQPARQAAFYRELVERAARLPGVRFASISDSIPPERVSTLEIFEVEGKPVPPGANRPMGQELVVGPDYFRALGIPLLQGRALDAQDTQKSLPAVVINRTMAQRFFPGGEALGKRMQAGGFGPEETWFTVVGVAGDVQYSGLSAAPEPTFYLPYEQNLWAGGEMNLVLRASTDPEGLVEALRGEVRALDPSLPLSNIQTGKQLLFAAAARSRFQTLLIALFAFVALVLSGVGIYGVISYAAAQRTHEIGVRLALGARPRDVIAMVVGQGMRLAIAGVGLGLVGAFSLTWLMQGLLFHVGASDPLTYVSIAVLLSLVALLACYLPARRASKVDPMNALRYE
jgi:putative ABC transport system permease protein